MELGVNSMHCVGTLELIMTSHKSDALGSDTVPREQEREQERERATMMAVNVNADSQLVKADPKLIKGKC